MKDEKSQIMLDEFVKLCDYYLAKMNCSKRELAETLHIEYSYLSKLYNNARPVPGRILEKLRQICTDQKKPNSEKLASLENLPNNPNQSREEAAAQRALQDQSRKELLELRDRVAVLEKDLQRAKSDSEKKIYELEGRCAATIRIEIERITSRLAGGRGTAANDR